MQQIYIVFDTNAMLDDPYFLSRPEFANAHCVIPHKGLEEIDNIRHREGISTERAGRAHKVIKELNRLFLQNEEYNEKQGVDTLFMDAFNLDHPLVLNGGKQFVHILSVPKDYIEKNPLDLEEKDMDGKILLTAQYVKELTKKRWWQFFKKSSKVILLTSDKCFTIRAVSFGIKTMPYRYRVIDRYTGRRDLEVPKPLIDQFVQTGFIPRAEWERVMPEQPPLVMNEFIIMHGSETFSLFEHIGRYDTEKDGLVKLQYAHKFWPTPKNPGQAIYAEALYNPFFEVVLCKGLQGSGKTFMASVFAHRACSAGIYSKALVSTRDIGDAKHGALPGNLEAKMTPASQPIIDALRNYFTMLGGKAEPGLNGIIKDSKPAVEIVKISELKSSETTKESKPKKVAESQKPKSLQGPTEEEEINARTGTSKNKTAKTKDEKREKKAEKKEKKKQQAKNQEASDPAIRARDTFNKYFETLPYEHMQGRDLARTIAIYDEFQCHTHKQTENLLTRLGRNSKMLIMGDCGQTEEGQNNVTEEDNGLTYASYLLKQANYPPAVQVSFLEDEVVRHPFVTAILKVIKRLKAPKAA